MNELQVFNFNGLADVRTVSINDTIWFVAKDISDALGYSDTNKMVSRLDDDESMTAKLAGMNMNSILVNESGLYSAIFGSNKPDAKLFRKWVTSEVLPTIRKTGKYDISQSQWLEEKQSLESKVNQLILKIETIDTQAHYTVMDNMTLLSDLNVLCFLKRRELDDEEKRTKTARKIRDTLKYNVYHMDFFQLEEVYKDRLELEELRIKAEDIVYKYDPSNPRRFKLQSLPNTSLPNDITLNKGN